MAYAEQTSIRDAYQALAHTIRLLLRPPWMNPTNKRLNVDVQSAVISSGTITTVSTVTTVTGLTNIGGVDALNNVVRPAQKYSWSYNVRSRIS